MFAGRRFQRGHGFGTILGGFVRRPVLPFFQANASSMLKKCCKDWYGSGRLCHRGTIVRGFSKEASACWYKKRC